LAALASALLTALAPAAPVATAKTPTPAKVTIAKVTAKDTKITVAGKVTLPSTLKNTAKNRKKVKVAFTLTGGKGARETFTATITSKRTFAATHTTKLTGALGLAARVKIGSKVSGKAVTKGKAVTIAGGSSTNGSGAQGSSPTSSTTTPSSTTPAPNSPGADATPLVGTFRLDPGVSYIDGRHRGTWFQMRTPGNSFLVNGDSTSRNKEYTLLNPGTDGGLRTDVFQGPPTPAFGPTGESLGDRIVQPTKFFGQYFSVVTAPVDPQLGTVDPLPQVFVKDGKLSGQVTAFNAGWNSNWFNQGSPKPDGTSVGFTAPVSGTYDPTTRRFVLEWSSLIVSGPFDTFGGNWHFEGTFQPAAG
jgi:hypothetical protein